MEKYKDILEASELFAGLSSDEILSMVKCLDGRLVNCKKGEHILSQGDSIESISLLLSGKVHIESTDFWGGRNILSVIRKGEIFAEAYAFGAVSSIKLLSANTTSKSEQNEANAENSYARNVPTNEQITFAQRVDEYVDVVDGFIGGSSPVKIQEESLTDAEYSTKVTTDITHLSGQKDSFVMYYNETVPTEDDRKTDDDDDFDFDDDDE